MKVAVNKYLYLIIVLLLNTFASAYANDFTSNVENSSIESSLKELHSSKENSFNQNKTTSTFTSYHKDRQRRLLFDCIEINEVDEESTSSEQLRDTNYLNATSTNSHAFKSFSRELQKHKQYICSILSKPRIKLHLLFQVFVI